MKDDYLWDGTGEPDPEVERLEQMLSVYKYQPKKLDLPARPSVWFSPRLAAAAALVLMAVAGLLVFLNKDDHTPPTVADKDNTAVEQPATTAREPSRKRILKTCGQGRDLSNPGQTAQQVAKSAGAQAQSRRESKESSRTPLMRL